MPTRKQFFSSLPNIFMLENVPSTAAFVLRIAKTYLIVYGTFCRPTF